MDHHNRWTTEKIAKRLALIEPLVYRYQQPLEPFRLCTLDGPETVPPVEPNVQDAAWAQIEPNTYWGAWLSNYVLRTHFQAPPDWDKTAPIALYLPIGEAGDFSHPEALAYIDGQPYAACDRHHQEILLSAEHVTGQSHLLALHTWTGLGGFASDTPQTKLFMRPCAIVQIDQPTRDFIATARVALGIANALEENVPAKGWLLNALDDAFKLLDTREPWTEHFYASVGLAHETLRSHLTKIGAPLDVSILATGHAHIDVAWLWTLGQTRRKAGRTFHTVLRLMEQFPAFHFTQSQPQLYDYVRQDYPALFDAIKTQISEQRWEPIGGMWVEADCNLSGHESLARQFLLGRTFFREHFGPDAESPVLWLPDVFGYAWALPQLIKQAGLEYFFTIKIGWSQYNRLPFDSFWWQGLDGTRVLTHFSPTPEEGSPFASTYNAKATPTEVMGTWTNFQQKAAQRELLMAFGYGDGGGGPTREMLENLREMEQFPATPQVRQGSVTDFFRKLEAESGAQLPTWNGELYLELHRGTYTTQSRNKRANRKSEFLLHDAEFLAATAGLLDPNYRYPTETLRKAWELVCLNQFHDIIPGSSITPVYVESLQQYEEVQQLGSMVRDEALQAIVNQLDGNLILVNPTSFSCANLLFWPSEQLDGQHLRRSNDTDDTVVTVQPTVNGTWIDAGTLAPFSFTALSIHDGTSARQQTNLTATTSMLENDYVRVDFDESGDITQIYDKQNQRNVTPPESIANQFQAFEDRPLNWDAWDIDIFYDDKMWTAEPAQSIEVTENGPLRATLEIRRRILQSDFIQHISLCYNSPQIDFDTTIQWRERHILLKVAFPVEILAPLATYEIQWGNVQRPTHRNTSWDWARFETCAQKWVDLSEGDYGVSLLNDCKYGHDIHGNIMRISLLRAPTMPDPEADQGEHHFAYSLLPHGGAWNEQTIAAAYALNDPLLLFEKCEDGSLHQQVGQLGDLSDKSIIAADPANIVIETIKEAEDGRGIIVRFYESQRQRGRVTLTTAFPIREAWQTNLLEEDQTSIQVDGQQIDLDVTPYEIVTVRIVA